MSQDSGGSYRLLGSVLSPFSNKLRLLCSHAGLPFRWLPEEGSTLENLEVQALRQALRRGLRRLTYPPLGALGELPLVPFLFGPRGDSYYDSSAIGRYLHDYPPLRPGVPLLPSAPVPRFFCLFLEEAFDELGLYILHHQRWVRSARSTRAPQRVAAEFSSLVPWPLQPLAQRRFAARQVRRLPYLFSVAAADAEASDLPRHRRPPARSAFPPTHALLEILFVRWLSAIEQALVETPFLFGPALTIADAAVYGMISSHLALDPESTQWIETHTPTLARWTRELEKGASHRVRYAPLPASTPPSLLPLIRVVTESFVPLLLQNEAAYEHYRHSGQRRFNEAAFDAGEALYDGVLLGHPYRSVAKTFQVAVLRELRCELRRLTVLDRRSVEELSAGVAAMG